MKLLYATALLWFYSLCVSAFTNPLKNPNGSDPFMVYSNGYYYLMTTTWSNLQITRATSMAGLKTAQPKVVWTDTTASRCCNMWAPEIHQVSGSWYIYYTAGPSGNNDSNRIHAIKGSASDIWASSWSYAGVLVPGNRDKAMLDGTVLSHSSGNYLVWSSWEDGVGQSLFIAKMNSPTSIGNSAMISKPTNSWEKVGAAVNEGPAPLYHGGRTWIVFSASLCSTTGYSLGRIELTGSDPLQPSSWVKYNNGPIFSAANGNYAPGHNGFFTPPSGNIWIVYHASPSSAVTCDGNRRTMAQPVNWNSDGTPNLGQPLPLSQNIAEPA
ncbi:glycoside hydrolase family 43 protein [Ceratobasidium sp. AG-Ba]|nr:glycoside hydrolase family 43 protein [Ceratobasidium sp. AG-Ba]QRW09440.1 glycoside hydrolase family 43 protein [Ceratobasidium sp. AG-Ba]